MIASLAIWSSRTSTFPLLERMEQEVPDLLMEELEDADLLLPASYPILSLVRSAPRTPKLPVRIACGQLQSTQRQLERLPF
jgi:hypothetical protein